MKNQLESKNSKGIVNVSILNLPTKIAGSIFICIAGITAGWAFMAPIPVKVNGLGVLAPVDGLFTYKSPSSGRVLLPFIYNSKESHVKYTIPEWSMEAYKFINDGEVGSHQDSVQLAKDILKYLNLLQTTRMPTSHFSGGIATGGNYTVQMKEGDVVAIIDQPAARQSLTSSLLNLNRSIRNYRNLLAINKESLKLSKDVEQAKTSLLAPLDNLVSEGFASQYEFNNALADATSTRINVSEYSSKLQNLKLEISKNEATLVDSLSKFLRDTVVFAFDDAYVQSFTSTQWDFVQPGSELVTVSWSEVSDPSLIPVFVDQRAATEVDIGHKVILTPLGFSSAEVGGIVGYIESLEPIPYTTSTLSERLSSKGLATVVSPRGSAYQVNVKLQRKDMKKLRKEAETTSQDYGQLARQTAKNDNSGGYIWNNRSNPPIAPREGFLLSSQITTRVQTPIQMLIPAIKQFSGIAPPDKLIRFNINQP